MLDKNLRHKRRDARTKNSISLGTTARPRLVVNRTNTRLFAQVIDDGKAITLIGLDTRIVKEEKGDTKTVLSQKLGKIVAEKAKELKIKTMVFDRNGFLYHGRIKAFCEAVRENGITI